MQDTHGGNIGKICSAYGLAPEEVVDFSANINPLGFPAEIENAICSNINALLHYPDPNCCELKKKLALRYDCKESNIVMGNGSTELFYLIPRAVLPERGFLFQPTFTEFPRALKCAGVSIEEIICRDDDLFKIETNRLSHYIDKFHVQETNSLCPHSSFKNIIFLCNPNNPTGHLIEKGDIIDLTQNYPDALIVIDEAFMDLTSDPERYSVIDLAAKADNLIVVRSLTKLYGIPGIRLGFLVANKNITDKLLLQKEPWSVNSFAQFAGTVAVDDTKFVTESRAYTNIEKDFLFNELSKIEGIYSFKPSVNFILIKILDMELTASDLFDRLIKSGIIIRNCSNFVALSEKYFRVAVRKREENIRLITALKDAI